jgi:type IV pilus assembly protein PilA
MACILKYKKSSRLNRGFTLLEILLVVAIIAVLAGIVIVAINPSKQIASAHNVQRKADVKTLYDAVNQFYIDRGYYPASTTISTTPQNVCNTGDLSGGEVSCGGSLDLSELVPIYLPAIPVDATANVTSGAGGSVGYQIATKPAGSGIIAIAPNTEIQTYAIAIGTTTVAVGGSEPPPENPLTALRVGLLTYLPLDSDVLDNSGNGHNGILNGATPGTAKVGSGSYDFNGSSNEITFSDNSVFPFGAGDKSECVWAKPTAGGVVTAAGNGSQGNSFRIVDNSGDLYFSGGYSADTFVTSAFPVGQWTYICVVYDSSQTLNTFYVNGVSSATNSNALSTDSGYPFVIGQYGPNWNSGYFSGSIDEVAIWNRVLTGSEVTQLYNGGAGLSLVQ